jgi:hypothetical protein
MEAASQLLSEILLGSCAAAAGLLDCGSTHTHTHIYIYCRRPRPRHHLLLHICVKGSYYNINTN